MPISALHRERIEALLAGHQAALDDDTPALNPTQVMVHTKLLELGRVPGILKLLDEFAASPDLYERIRQDSAGVLHSRGIQLPEDVVMTALDGEGDGAPPILRFRFPVHRPVMLVDYDVEAGVSTRLATPTRNDYGLYR